MNITPKDLLDAGVHLGHQTRRWNPRSKPYVFGHRQGITIIDLEKTHAALEKACAYIENLVASGGDVLLVGTKRQAQELVREAAAATNMPYVTTRWMGGTLTNFETIKKSLAKFKKYQTMDSNGDLAKLPKKEESAIRREMARMTRNFDGITNLAALPGAVFAIDVSYEEIAVREAKRMNIASIGLVDTNSDPTLLTHPIPGNDDATKSIRIVIDAVVEAIQKGLAARESRHTTRQADKTEAAPAAVAADGATEAPVAAPSDDEAPAGDKPAGAAPRKRSTRTAGAKKSAVSTEDV
ncbi:MAG TPA: 30S ribosomal protein S2 [Candidatus Didemnitutus sp.]|nr:30S ribosomal protein S2 [Candidatus Didemnitutus sp.]